MNTTDLVHFLRVELPTIPAVRRSARVPSGAELAAPVRSSIFRARQFLVGRQRLDGSWAGRGSADARVGTSRILDTALAVEALHTSGLGRAHPAIAAGVDWLMNHRVAKAREPRNLGEQAALFRVLVRLRTTRPPDRSHLPPDLRLTADGHFGASGRTKPHRPSRVRQRSIDELQHLFLPLQRPDGGWAPWNAAAANPRRSGAIGAVRRRPNSESSPEATGAMLALLSQARRTSGVAVVRRGAEYLHRAQRADGSWESASGARFLLGTTWAIHGLVAAGQAPDDRTVAAGVNWLLTQQRNSGGWGEGFDSAIQTAWVVLALVVAGQTDHDATRRAVRLLVDTQEADGCWIDSQLTERDSATGGWYRNDLDAAALPLMALAHWAVTSAAELDGRPVALRLVCSESPH